MSEAKRIVDFDLEQEYKECPICKALVPWGTMIWLNGLCTCPKCYEHRRRERE